MTVPSLCKARLRAQSCGSNENRFSCLYPGLKDLMEGNSRGSLLWVSLALLAVSAFLSSS